MWGVPVEQHKEPGQEQKPVANPEIEEEEKEVDDNEAARADDPSEDMHNTSGVDTLVGAASRGKAQKRGAVPGGSPEQTKGKKKVKVMEEKKEEKEVTIRGEDG